MTKAEITNSITICLSKTPITLIDLLDSNIKLDSYEKYVQELSLIKKSFKNDIPEFSNEAISFLDKMENFIESCESKIPNIQNYIDSNLRNQICGYGSINIKPRLISPNSLSLTPERSENAIKQIYYELGTDCLDYYIQLLKTPSQLTSYLNDSKKQIVAMHYILYATGHHSSTKLRRNMSSQTLHNLTESSIRDSINEITSQKNDYINFMNSEKQNYTNWFNESTEKFDEMHSKNQNDYDTFLNDSNERLESLEKTYSEKLKVEKPSEYMENKAKEYGRKTIYWSIATIILSIGLICLLGLILNPSVTFTEKLITIQLFNNEMPVYSSIVIFAMIALVIYVLKIFIKMIISSKHLREEYYQKHILTYFYLSLVKDNNLTQEQGNIILATLFSKADTGLIKGDMSSDIESIYKLMITTKNS